MASKSWHSETLIDILQSRHKDFPLRNSIKNSDILSATLEEILRDREHYFKRLSGMPNVGDKTVEMLRFVLQNESERLLSLADDDANTYALPDDIREIFNRNINSDIHNAVEFTQINGVFHTGAMGEHDLHPFKLLAETKTKRTFYLPLTIPDIFKTESVWKAEHGSSPVSKDYQSRVVDVLEAAKKFSGVFHFIIDEYVWKNLCERRGVYKTLSDAELSEQLGVFKSIAFTFPDRVSLSTANFQRDKLTSCILVPSEFITSYMFGGHYVCKDLRLVNHAYRTIKRAKKNPILLR